MSSTSNDRSRKARRADLDERLRRDVERVRAVPSPLLKQRVLAEVARLPLGAGADDDAAEFDLALGRLRTFRRVFVAAAAAVVVSGALWIGFGPTLGSAPDSTDSTSTSGTTQEAGELVAAAGRPSRLAGPLVAEGARQAGRLGSTLDGALVSELENLFLDVSLAAERVVARLPLPRGRRASIGN